MGVSPRPLLVVVGAGPHTRVQRQERHVIDHVPQRFVAGEAELDDEQSAYNRHFESVCYHLLFVFNQDGDCLAATLRAGIAHSADGWEKILLPVIERSQARGRTVVVRADAALTLPALYDALEGRGVTYSIRLPANQVLELAIEDLLVRPRGRPSYAPLVRYRSFQYQAASCDPSRRVIAKVEHHPGELFPRVGFIVTTLTGTSRSIVHFYNQRGTAEQWIKEGKEATHWTRLSCHRFRANEVRLLLGVSRTCRFFRGKR
jgi:Transposase DDE domain group 1